MVVRPEIPDDLAAIHAVHAAAFPTEDEASLVDAVRASGRLIVSLVAEEGGAVVGHIAFTPVSIDGAEAGLGLAPIAVVPEYQRRGIGSQLVREGLARASGLGVGYVVVLGHPEYYPRFGFQPAAKFGLDNEYGAGEAFMVLELRPGAVPAAGGLVRYGPEFGGWIQD